MPNRPADTASARAARLYDEFGESLYRYAVILLADAGAAEDAIQQVFAALLRQRGTIDNEAHYLRRAIRNECYSMLRGRIREQALPRSLLEPVAKEGADRVLPPFTQSLRTWPWAAAAALCRSGRRAAP